MGSDNNTYDAIVIGSGISGGWAAKELCEKGLEDPRPGARKECRAYQRLSNRQSCRHGNSDTGSG